MKDLIALLNAKTIYKRHNSGCGLPWVVALLVCGVLYNASAEVSRDAALGALKRLDYDGAAEILQHLANDGDARAQAALSNLVDSGKLAKNTNVPGVELLRKAADQGLGLAALELGNRYHLGTGVEQNQKSATKWWTVAAEKGMPRAAFNLGLTYSKGLDGPVNLGLARQWFEIAAANGLIEAEFALGVIEFSAESYSAAFGHFESAAMSGLAIAQYNLATMFERGLGQPADIDKAISWYQLAANSDIELAVQSLERLEIQTAAHNTAMPTLAINTVDWVLRQPGTNFTLQVAFVSSMQATISILERYDPSVDRAYISLAPPTADAQYIALVGSFASYLEAITFLNSLDRDLRANKPWIRRFTSVHTQLSAQN